MERFEVLLFESAAEDVSGLPEKERARVKKALFRLSENPFVSRALADIKKLGGKSRDYYRLRIGNYRVVYFVEGRCVKVTELFRRSKGHGWLD